MANKILSMLSAGLRLKCPRCSVGRLFRRPFSMNSYCSHCGLKFEREQGYFVGAIYINYAATVGIAVPGFFLLDTFTHMTIHQQLALWVPFAVIFLEPSHRRQPNDAARRLRQASGFPSLSQSKC